MLAQPQRRFDDIGAVQGDWVRPIRTRYQRVASAALRRSRLVNVEFAKRCFL
jgi:hypothetical protein